MSSLELSTVPLFSKEASRAAGVAIEYYLGRVSVGGAERGKGVVAY